MSRAPIRTATVFLVLFCISSHFYGITAANTVRTVSVACDAQIPMDSTTPVEAAWSLKKLMSWRNASNVALLSFSETSEFSRVQTRAMERVTSAALHQITVFVPVVNSFSSSCILQWNPQSSLFIDVDVTAASIALFTSSASVEACSVFAYSGATYAPLLLSGTLINSSSRMQHSILSSEDSMLGWPLTLRLEGSDCNGIRLLLSVNREVSMSSWWQWIPSTVFTAVMMPIALITVLSARRPSTTMYCLMMGLVFVGLVGESVGLLIAVTGWQVASGRYFPFPSSVTFHLSLWAAYVIMLPLMLLRHPFKELLFNGVTRAVLYALFVSHVVAYWVSGFVAIASVGIAMILALNLILIVTYARFVGLFSVSRRAEEEFRSIPSSWLAPLTPFVPPLLMYADLFLVHMTPKGTMNPLLLEAVTLFNVHSSVPFTIFCIGTSNALLIAATTYHATFLIPLVQNLILSVWYVMWSVVQIIQARQRWKAEQLPVHQVLWPTVQMVVDRFNMELYNKAAAAAASLASGEVDHADTNHHQPRAHSSSATQRAPSILRHAQPVRHPPPPPGAGRPHDAPATVSTPTTASALRSPSHHLYNLD